MKADRTPVSTAISDSLGRYELVCDTGSFVVLYTCAGYRPLLSKEFAIRFTPSDSGDTSRTNSRNPADSPDKPVAIQGTQLDSVRLYPYTTHASAHPLPDVLLQRDTTQLTAVTVYGRKPIIEPSADGFTYNAENDAAIAAGTAVDLLRKIPMVSITQDGSPSIRGSLHVRVFIDNRPSTVYATSVAEALQQIPSEEIARVEIITHPSARYDAEGTDAVINIITRKRRYDGYNGNLRSNIGNWNQDLTGTLKWRSGYWIATINGELYRSVSEGGYTLHRSAGRHETASRFEQERARNSRQGVQILSLNLTRIIDSLNAVNFHYRLRHLTFKENAVHTTTLYTNNTVADDFIRVVPTWASNVIHTFSGAWSGQSRNKKREFNLLGVFFGHLGRDDYDLDQLRQQIVDYREKSDGEAANRDFSLQGDLVQQFSSMAKLETGFNTTWRTNRTQNLVDIFNFSQDKFIRDEQRSSNFDMQRDVYAAYASFHIAIKKWQGRAGIRFEQTRMFTGFKDTALQVPDFLNWLPNLLLRYSFNQKHSFTYSYATRIARPFTFYLNPYINYADSFNINYGNPNLVPEVTHLHTFDYNYNNHSLFAGISLAYRRTRNAIEEIRIFRPDKVIETTYRNIGWADNWSLNIAIRHSPGKRFSLSNTVTIQYIDRKSPALNIQATGFVFRNSFSGAYRFGKSYSVESYITYESGSINLQYSQGYYLFYNLLFTRSLLNDKLNITFRADGFFNPWFYRDLEFINTSFYQSTTYRYINRQLRLAISWKFGKQDLRTPTVRTAEPGD